METISLQELGRRFASRQMTVEGALSWMSQHGSSVSLNWGEDTSAWECSWIVGGRRFTGNRGQLHLAILEAMNGCFEQAAFRSAPIEGEKP